MIRPSGLGGVAGAAGALEGVGDLGVAVADDHAQGRDFVVILGVDIGAVGQQQRDHLEMTAGRGAMQRGHAVQVGRQRYRRQNLPVYPPTKGVLL